MRVNEELELPLWDEARERLSDYVRSLPSRSRNIFELLTRAINLNEGSAIVEDSKPSAAAELQGQLWVTRGTGGGGADELFICLGSGGGVYAWTKIV